MQIEEAARIIEAEGSVLDFQGKLGIAQCICDNRFEPNAFTKPSDSYSIESLKVAEMAILEGVRRLPDAKILQFRSFRKYGIDGEPNFDKIYNGMMPQDLLYLGKDGEGEWGHFYFGRYSKMSKKFKMLVMAGHGENVDGSFDPGALGCGYREADLTRELSKLIFERARENGIDCDLAPDRNHYSWFRHGNTYDVSGYDYVLEVHFNASVKTDPVGDGVLKGTMFYIDQSEKGHSVEDAILRNLYDIGTTKAWDGVVVAQRQWPSGLGVQQKIVQQGVSHAVLETCFITDADDMKWYQRKKALIATQIVRGIITGFGLFKETNPYAYVGKGIATYEALEDMNVRDKSNIYGELVGVVARGLRVEVLSELSNGWLKVVWPGSPKGYAYTSNVANKFYKMI